VKHWAVSGAALAASILPINLMASTPDLISGITGGAEHRAMV